MYNDSWCFHGEKYTVLKISQDMPSVELDARGIVSVITNNFEYKKNLRKNGVSLLTQKFLCY